MSVLVTPFMYDLNVDHKNAICINIVCVFCVEFHCLIIQQPLYVFSIKYQDQIQLSVESAESVLSYPDWVFHSNFTFSKKEGYFQDHILVNICCLFPTLFPFQFPLHFPLFPIICNIPFPLIISYYFPIIPLTTSLYLFFRRLFL